MGFSWRPHLASCFFNKHIFRKIWIKKDSLCGSLECPNPVERFRNLRNLKFMELRMKFLKAFGTIYNFICECDRNIYRDSALLFSLTLLTFFSLFFKNSFSYWTELDSKIFPKYIWRGSQRTVLSCGAAKRVLPQQH